MQAGNINLFFYIKYKYIEGTYVSVNVNLL